MFDPGAMGTLLIGLNAEREKARDDRQRRHEAVLRRERRPGIRVALAHGLRRAAELLERPAVREVANQAPSVGR